MMKIKMSKGEATKVARELLIRRLETLASGSLKADEFSKNLYICIRKMATNETIFIVRSFLKCLDKILHLIAKRRIGKLKQEQQKIGTALSDLDAGQVNFTVDLLQANWLISLIALTWSPEWPGVIDGWILDVIEGLEESSGKER